MFTLLQVSDLRSYYVTFKLSGLLRVVGLFMDRKHTSNSQPMHWCEHESLTNEAE